MDHMLLEGSNAGIATARGHWANDDLSKCRNEDRLLGFAIHAARELEKSSQRGVDDMVLYCLFRMELLPL